MDKVTVFALCALCSISANTASAQSAPVQEHVASWQDFIGEAAYRFAVPQNWIRAVMGAESGGRTTLHGRPITSPKGAMGLMQVMPSTYSDLSHRYGLGSDSYDPHNSILAGTAYLREMYERYGYPLLFAAYNAGPRRVDDYLLRGIPLPSETKAYVSGILPDTADLAFGGLGDADIAKSRNAISPAPEAMTDPDVEPKSVQSNQHFGSDKPAIAPAPTSIFVTLSDREIHSDTRLFVPLSASDPVIGRK